MEPGRIVANSPGLVFCVRRSIWVGILEGRELGDWEAAFLLVKNDVVLLRAVELDQPKLRLYPVDAVCAFGVADNRRMRYFLPGFRCNIMATAVIHAVQATVLENRKIEAGVALPGHVCDQHHFAWGGSVETPHGATVQTSDQKIIDHQFQS